MRDFNNIETREWGRWKYRGADKSLARTGRKKARNHVRDARDFNNIETRDWGKWNYRGAHKSLARPGREQARKHVRDARDFNNIDTRAVIKYFFFLQGKAPKEIHAILTETLACFLPGRAKDLSSPLVWRLIRVVV